MTGTMRIRDFTKMKLDKSKNIVKCPVCGKTAEWRHYPGENFDTYVHEIKLGAGGLFWEITKSCEYHKEKNDDGTN